MITFSQLGKHGRFGNSLFQYATLYAAGLRNGLEVKIPNVNTTYMVRAAPRYKYQDLKHGESEERYKCLLSELNLTPLYLNVARFENYYLRGLTPPEIEKKFNEKDSTKFYPEILDLQDKTDILGFFQHVKYFDDFEEEIKKEFTFKDNIITETEAKLSKFRKKNLTLVSVHIRRGDWMTFGDKKFTEFYGPVLGEQPRDDVFSWESHYGKYLKQALKHVDINSSLFMIFTGGGNVWEDKQDEQWCLNNLKFLPNMEVVSTSDAILDFSLMSCCDVFINCHSSSFAWWASYLSNTKDKKIISPKHYRADLPDTYIKTLYPPDWILC